MLLALGIQSTPSPPLVHVSTFRCFSQVLDLSGLYRLLRVSIFFAFPLFDFLTFRLFGTFRDFSGLFGTFRDFSTFRLFDFSTFRLFDFSTFRLFGTFRTFRVKPLSKSTFRLFDFSTFRLFDFSTFRVSLSVLHLRPRTTVRNHRNCAGGGELCPQTHESVPNPSCEHIADQTIRAALKKTQERNKPRKQLPRFAWEGCPDGRRPWGGTLGGKPPPHCPSFPEPLNCKTL